MDLAGPGISTYEEVDKLLPNNYEPILGNRDTQVGLFALKRFIEDGLQQELNLMMVQVPLLVEAESGYNDMLDRDGSRTPVEFEVGLGLANRMKVSIVQAATKWKRFALKQFECGVGEGVLTDMRAIRKDYFIDHDHSCYVDQWDWEKAIGPEERTLEVLKDTVQRIYKVIKGAETFVQKMFPELEDERYPNLPEEIFFIHAEELVEKYPNMSRKERETMIVKEKGAVFIIGIGMPLHGEGSEPWERRATDYDDWSTETVNGYHGINGDIIVFNHVTQRRHELSSMGVRVDKDSLKLQMKMGSQEENLKLPYHQAILNDEIPLSIGGGIGQTRTFMLLLRKAHFGECAVSVWPKELRAVCEKHNIHVLD